MSGSLYDTKHNTCQHSIDSILKQHAQNWMFVQYMVITILLPTSAKFSDCPFLTPSQSDIYHITLCIRTQLITWRRDGALPGDQKPNIRYEISLQANGQLWPDHPNSQLSVQYPVMYCCLKELICSLWNKSFGGLNSPLGVCTALIIVICCQYKDPLILESWFCHSDISTDATYVCRI
jgi:hypothetical protein